MAQKRVLILGASRYYSKSIEAVKNAGYFVIAVDREANSSGFAFADVGIKCDIIDKQEVLRVSRLYQIDGIIPVNDYGVPTAAFVAKELNLPGITPGAAVLATNKEKMREAWRRRGIPCPQVEIAVTKGEFFTAIEKVGLPCIFKPAHGIGGGSRGVIVVNELDEVEQAIEFTQKFYSDKTTLVESFIEAEQEHSAEVLIYDGVPYVIAISDKIKTPVPYRVDKNVIYPTAITGKKLELLKEQIVTSVLALNITTGAAHVELATTKDGFVLFELGARCGGGGTPQPIVPFVTGIELFVELVRILTGDRPRNLQPARSFACNYHFLIPKPGFVESVKGIDRVREWDGILDAEIFIKSDDYIPQVTVGSERSGFIIAGALTREEALRLGQKAEQELEIEYRQEEKFGDDLGLTVKHRETKK